MRNKASLAISCLALVSPFVTAIVTMFFEAEMIEALFGGMIIGCILGSVLGIIALILNKGRNKLVIVFSVLPMIPLGIFLLLALPFVFYK